MKLSELIAHVGDDNVQFQMLAESVESARVSKNSSISFFTDRQKVEELDNVESEYVGMVVWLPRKRMPEFPLKKD